MSPSVADLHASYMPISKRNKSVTAYPQGPFTGQYEIGGGGGDEFSTCGWVTNEKALVVMRLQIWWTSECLRALQVVYSDNSTSELYGQPTGETASITFAPGEQITSLIWWGNGVGSRTGRIRILTNKGQEFNHGKDVNGQSAYSAPVGSGLLVGFAGRAGAAIDKLGAVFLGGSVSSIAIDVDNASYTPNLNGKSSGLSAVVLQRTRFSGAKTYDFHGDVNRTVSQTFTQTSSTTFGASISTTVTASPFGIGGSVTAGFTWETMATQESAATTSTEVSMGWGVSGDIPQGKGVTCSALTQMGVGTARYTSRVTVLLWDGSTTAFTEPGIFENVVYSETWVNVVPDTLRGKPGVPIEGPSHATH